MKSGGRAEKLKLVAIGGGTGLSVLLSGLKKHVGSGPADEAWLEELTAVVTVTDDGGSSGRLRHELQVLPPGDIRNCLVALSEDERLMSRLFKYRFPGRGILRGHNFGNLFLTALTGLTGDFIEAIKVSSEVLAVKGRIYPSTVQDVKLIAELANGERAYGESAISLSRTPIKRLYLSRPDCRPVPDTLRAIAEADIITVGPGSLYTSLLPNLLIKETVSQMVKSKALKIYICNIMTQPGETTGYRASDHVRAIYQHTRAPIFDCVIVNSRRVSPRMRRKYLKQGATQVENDISELEKLGLTVYARDLALESQVVRHDPELLAAAILEAYNSAA